jgi:rhodanese-related sulfurtransferase
MVLGVLALALGLLAPFTVDADPAREAYGGLGRPGVAELTAELARGAPLVEAVTVGEWIRDRKEIRILDLQEASAAVRFTIPTAEHLAFRDVASIPVDRAGTLILYDGGEGTAVRAWLLLRRLGHREVRILEGGVRGWIDGVISPVLPADTPAQRARYRRVAEISRYFGGVPRIGDPPPEPATSTEDAVLLLSRRGCY